MARRMRKNTADVGARRHGVRSLGKYIKFMDLPVVGLIRIMSLLIYLLRMARQRLVCERGCSFSRGRNWGWCSRKFPPVCGGAWAAEMGVVLFLSKCFIFFRHL